ncbi:MAG: SoxR reducing system RseC family protein [Bacteroidales bacterium]|nr:MAG: SoxR reducing system RseC family protein [Bacteroidales bacterium]
MDSAEIKHRGEVIRTEGMTVYVRMKVESACSACHARRVCGVGESADKVVEVETPSAAEYRAGDEVEVALQRRGMGAESVVLAYVAPFFRFNGIARGACIGRCRRGYGGRGRNRRRGALLRGALSAARQNPGKNKIHNN